MASKKDHLTIALQELDHSSCRGQFDNRKAQRLMKSTKEKVKLHLAEVRKDINLMQEGNTSKDTTICGLKRKIDDLTDMLFGTIEEAQPGSDLTPHKRKSGSLKVVQ